MSAATLRERIGRIAASAVMGKSARPLAPPPEQADITPSPAAIGEARRTAEQFAARLRELKQARDVFDGAVAAERGAGKIDLAAAVERGEPLPDVGDITANRARAELRLKAVYQLANRECEAAGHALDGVKRAALAEAKAARLDALRWVVEALPPVFDKPEEIAMDARIVREAETAIADLDKAPTLALRRAEFFGMQLPAFRLDALPERTGVPQRDALDPEQTAQDIETTLFLHGEAIRFRASILTDPAAAAWKGGQP